jgi:hypothetical protein
VDLLAERGPDLGRPVVDRMHSSRHQSTKELRAAKGGALRVLFSFDPRCQAADPQRTAEAALSIPIFSTWQASTGFDSVWESDGGNRQAHRVDPDTGETQAVIDVGTSPARLQTADGRMVVRTADAYQFIDPATNTIDATLLETPRARRRSRRQPGLGGRRCPYGWCVVGTIARSGPGRQSVRVRAGPCGGVRDGLGWMSDRRG